MLCKKCYHEIFPQDFYCRGCGLRTNKQPFVNQSLLSPGPPRIKQNNIIKKNHKLYFIYGFIMIGILLIIIIYLIFLIIKNYV